MLVIPPAILQPVLMDDKQLEQFLPYVAHCEVSHEMKMQILRDLWSVMESFADEAWGIGSYGGQPKKPDGHSN